MGCCEKVGEREARCRGAALSRAAEAAFKRSVNLMPNTCSEPPRLGLAAGAGAEAEVWEAAMADACSDDPALRMSDKFKPNALRCPRPKGSLEARSRRLLAPDAAAAAA